MKPILSLAIALSSLLLPSCSHEPFYPVPGSFIYSIKQHNDSIYFSTLGNGIFRFSPDHPEAVKRVAGKRTLPIRSIAFAKNGTLYAASYQDAVHYGAGDTLLPLFHAWQRAWSIKIDDADGVLWLAGQLGIFKKPRDSLVKFGSLGGVHDIAFFGSEVAVAHARGISLFDKNSGMLTKEFCQGVNCWSITRYDSLLVGGGANLCAIIDRDKCRTITLGSAGNYLWASARDTAGTFYLATQKGLYRIKPGGTKAECAGFRGECIKSLLFDAKGRLWVGKFTKEKNYSRYWKNVR